MRHIPEEELHAYLDQALSRSQCVEIESHLAACPACQAERDAIAALRDRTTALLNALAPERRVPPAFEVLQRRHQFDAARRAERRRRVVWAASVVAAVGLGWFGSTLTGELEQRPTRGATTGTALAASPERPVPATVLPSPFRPSSGAAVAAPRSDEPATASLALGERPLARRAAAPGPSAPRGVAEASGEARDSAPQIALRGPAQPSAVQLQTRGLPQLGPTQNLAGGWRTVSWDNARQEVGESGVPHIDGLPVMQVQVQKAKEGQKPLTVVAQQLQSGEVIRTIEGPAADVSSLLARPGGDSATATRLASPWPTIDPSTGRATEGYDGTMTMQRGDRILAITAHLPSDSLRAMIRRLNVELRGNRP